MLHFQKLRLNGFKSFVDRTELEIGQGLTGIVGPNGCGKSNLVEALRWVMGESSAKRMRGGGMEDVIFNGTSDRPKRNFAEVTLLLDNSDRSAPASYNSQDELEIIRRIERDHGSAYKVNGKVSRARDVQMLFADTVTGANSPALVSQGRVTAMINAKPQERRLILEESAGISGLYARRHEAELRLRAADQNLQRLDDLVGGMEERLNSLKKQSRQAQKYKNISAEIRHLELCIAWLEWYLLEKRVQEAQNSLGETETHVAEHMAVVAQLTKTQTTQAEELPALRQAEAEAAAALQAQKLALQRLEDQEKDIEHQITSSEEQLEILKKDKDHENVSLHENTTNIERIEKEESEIHAYQDDQTDNVEKREQAKDELEKQVSDLEEKHAILMQSAADSKATQHSLEQSLTSEKSRLEVLQEREETLARDLEKARANFEMDSSLGTLKQEILELEAALEAMRSQLQDFETKRAQNEKDLEEARTKKQDIEKKKSKIEGEINSLKSLLNADSQSDFKPVLQDIKPEKGYETALSRALGDTLMASEDADAPSIWMERDFDTSLVPAFPATVQSLSGFVTGPKPVQNALLFIGLVDTEDQGHALVKELKPGQSLVSRDGAYWRWDGLHVKSSASDKHAVELQQKNRLQDLEKSQTDLETQYQASETAFDKAKAAYGENQSICEKLTADIRANEQALSQKSSSLSRITEERSELFAKIAKLEEALSQTENDIETCQKTISEQTRALELYLDNTEDDQEAKLDAVKEELADARNELREAVRALDVLIQDQSRRKARLHAIADERVNLNNRIIRSRERLKDIDQRQEQLQEKLQSLKNRPSTIGTDREGLLSKIQELETVRSKASDKLSECEMELAETNQALKEAEAQLGQSREQRAHAQAIMTSGQENLDQIVVKIQEQFEKSPQDLTEDIKLDTENLPELETLKAEKDKNTLDRDRIGPVNLRADVEAEELEKELGGIFSERDDLIQAIEELREGINTLNKEARDRLTEAFETVNEHFQKLFIQLYGGGSAHLALIESDDPLTSGLEIFAQPPGKTLQSLSLLSGGEQTLASIALIFAMFLTNPSPICVLDEIDAPLDDANVDRVCDLLEDIAERGETRFLIITHHRLTMARMDRLYGVTMAERGVSQLVSVDLNQQLELLEAA